MAGYPGYPHQPAFWYEPSPRPLVAHDVPIYQRCTISPLGEELDDRDVEDENARHCFNCGATDHVLAGCPESRNHRLIALSRQMHDFFKSTASLPAGRIHEVEAWKNQRVQWLEAFEPGQVRGPQLRDALGLRDGDVGEFVPWLREIAHYGYPRGWIALEDPRRRVWKKIMQQDTPESPSDDGEHPEFSIFGETDEVVPIPPPSPVPSSPEPEEVPPDELEEGECPEEPAPRRWAQYPETYFSNSRLFVYEPPPPEPEVDPFEELAAWYERMWAAGAGREYTDFAQYAMPFLAPQPPSSPPPPLPPPPPSSPPPLPPSVPPPPPSEPPPLPPLPGRTASRSSSHIPKTPPEPPLLPPPKSTSSPEPGEVQECDMDFSDSESE